MGPGRQMDERRGGLRGRRHWAWKGKGKGWRRCQREHGEGGRGDRVSVADELKYLEYGGEFLTSICLKQRRCNWATLSLWRSCTSSSDSGSPVWSSISKSARHPGGEGLGVEAGREQTGREQREGRWGRSITLEHRDQHQQCQNRIVLAN